MFSHVDNALNSTSTKRGQKHLIHSRLSYSHPLCLLQINFSSILNASTFGKHVN
jgi:hypothetical protein